MNNGSGAIRPQRVKVPSWSSCSAPNASASFMKGNLRRAPIHVLQCCKMHGMCRNKRPGKSNQRICPCWRTLCKRREGEPEAGGPLEAAPEPKPLWGVKAEFLPKGALKDGIFMHNYNGTQRPPYINPRVTGPPTMASRKWTNCIACLHRRGCI